MFDEHTNEENARKLGFKSVKELRDFLSKFKSLSKEMFELAKDQVDASRNILDDDVKLTSTVVTMFIAELVVRFKEIAPSLDMLDFVEIVAQTTGLTLETLLVTRDKEAQDDELVIAMEDDDEDDEYDDEAISELTDFFNDDDEE
jgi:CRISPR/Cas system CSM-associated protein Csm4 (group 5 of RAMP superfamily)